MASGTGPDLSMAPLMAVSGVLHMERPLPLHRVRLRGTVSPAYDPDQLQLTDTTGSIPLRSIPGGKFPGSDLDVVAFFGSEGKGAFSLRIRCVVLTGK